LATVGIAATNTFAAEPSDHSLFLVTLSEISPTNTTVFYQLGGSATNGEDYQFLQGSVTIPANEQTGHIPLIVIDDALVEGGESVVVFLVGTDNPGVSIAPTASQAQIQIADNDFSKASIVAADPIAAEPGNQGLFSVRLSQPVPTNVTLSYQIGGTATNGVDYVTLSGSVEIPSGAISASIPVNVIDDSLFEQSESVVLTLTGANATTVVIDSTANSATVSIDDNEVNQPPVVTTNTGLTVAEGAMNVIDPSELTTSDPDTVPAALVYQMISGPANGTVRLNGNVTTTFTQADVNAGRVTYVHNGSETTSDGFAFTVSDGVTTTSGNSFGISITPVNDPPGVVGPLSDRTVTEDSPPSQINVSAVFFDPDQGDKLSLSVSSSNTALVSPTLSADGKTLTLTYGADKFGIATITLTASDLSGAQGTDVFLVDVNNVNDPVDAKDDSFSTLKNTTLTRNVLANDVDPDGDKLSAALLSATTKGTLSFTASGTFTYTPNPDFFGTDSFTYRVFDGLGTFDDAKVTITVTNINRDPVAVDDKFTMFRKTAFTGNVILNDSDPDGDALFATLQTPPAGGSIVVQANGNFAYTPPRDFLGTATFQYRLTDGQGGSAFGQVTISVTPHPQLDAADDFFARPEDTAVTGNVFANDIDPDGDSFSLISNTPPSNGTLTISPDGAFTYTPLPNFFDADSFTYTVQDSKGFQDTAKVTLVFAAVNDVDARDDQYATEQGKTLSVAAPGVLANDIDPDTNPEHQFPITGAIPFSGPSAKGGTVVLNVNGSFTYTPAATFQGLDSFTYTITDSQGGNDTAKVIIAVSDVNDPPIAIDDKVAMPANGTLQIDVLANDTDPDLANPSSNEKLNVVAVGSPANGITSIGTGGAVSYSPNPNFIGTDSFTYTIADRGGLTSTATVTVTVSATGALIANNDAFQVNEDTIRNQLDVLKNDASFDKGSFRVSSVTQGAKGIVEVGSNGVNVLYTPDPNVFGVDTFSYTISDDKGSKSTAQVTVTVLDVPEPPNAVDDKATILEDSGANLINVLANDTDPNGDSFKITAVSQGKNGGVQIRPGGADLVYTPNANFSGIDRFTYTITTDSGISDTAVVDVIVTGVPDAPDAKNDLAVVPRGAVSIDIDVLANDLDGDGEPLSIIAITSPLNGLAVINAGGKSIRYTPEQGFSGSDLFQYTVADPSGLTDSATVLLEVNVNRVDAVNDAFITPIAVPVFFGDRGLLANDVDPEGDAIVKAVLATGPANGTVTMNDDGSFTYVSNAGFTGVDTFTYIAFDALGAQDTATVSINVVDAAPEATRDIFSVQENSDQTFIPVLANDADPEGKPLKIIAVMQPLNGKVTIVPGGLVYTPNPGFVGTDEFSYTVSDDDADVAAASTQVVLVTMLVHGNSVQYFPMEDDFSRPEDVVITLSEADLLANDYNPTKQTLTLASVSDAVGGTAVLNADKSVTFTPDANYFGPASFNYKAAAPFGAATGTVIVDYEAVQDLPVAQSETLAVDKGSVSNSLDVLANDVDVDGDLLLVSKVTQGASGAVAIGPGGLSVSYTPQPNFTGADSFTYTISDGNGGTATTNVTVLVVDSATHFVGTLLDDVFLVRLDAGGTNLEIYDNDSATGTPIYTGAAGSLPSLLFDALDGDDRLIVDFVNGNPLPTGGIDFLAAGHIDGDQLILKNGGAIAGSLTPNALLPGCGAASLGGLALQYFDVEPMSVAGFDRFTAVTPGVSDTLSITTTAPGEAELSGASGSVALSPITFRDIGTFVIDAATNDGGAGNDALTISGDGDIPDSAGFLEYLCGAGVNTLSVQSGVARIDAKVAGGMLDTTVAAGAELVTHRLYQTALNLGDGSRATILPDGTNAAVSKLNTLAIGTGAALDINDNALLLNYSGASPEAAIREKIIEGRGGAGIGNGSWTGTGITSTAAAAANELDPESRAIGYADNGALPLGAYTTFRGQTVDATTVLIAYTRTGDATLDSLVNDDDATILGAFYPSASGLWASGDFDFSDTVDDDDATLLGAFYDPNAAPLATPQIGGPTSIGDAGAHDAVFAEVGTAELSGLEGNVGFSAADLAAIVEQVSTWSGGEARSKARQFTGQR
jgi:hypothetical protein